MSNHIQQLVTLTLCLAAPAAAFGDRQAIYRGKTCQQWIAELADGDDRTQWYATYALGQIGPAAAEAVQPLMKLLEDPYEHEYVRSGTAWALGQIGPAAEGAVPLLIATIPPRQASVRRNTPLALGKIGPAAKSAVPTLLGLLDDPDRGVRANAAAALWKIDRHDRAIPFLVEMIRRGTGSGPYKAVDALGQLGPDAAPAVPALAAAFRHPDDDVPRLVARTLAKIGPAAVPALKQSLSDPSQTVRRQAVESLGWIGQPAVGVLIEALQNDKPAVRLSAARALGRLGPDARDAVPALIQAVDDPDQEVRSAAGRALGRVGPGSEGQSAPQA